MTDANSIEIFSILDEFCKYFAPELGKHTLDTSGKRRRNRLCLMSDSEAMTILVLFHIMRHCDLKSFYLAYVCNHMRKEFPHRLSYNRLVERQAKVGLQLLRFLQICALDIHYRPHSIEVMQYKACTQPQDDEGMGGQGQVYDGVVLNDRGEIIQWTLTPGNVDDREPLKEKDFTQRLFGKTLPTRDT